MIIIDSQKKQHITPAQVSLFAVFSLGIIAAFLLVLAALVAAAYILNIAMTTLVECAQHIAVLYNHSDSFVQLLIIVLIGFCFTKSARLAYRFLRK